MVEVPLLFESGMEGVFDATIAVVADEDARGARRARGHAAVAERAGRQLTQEEKADRADFTVRNDGSLEELKGRCPALLAKLEPTVSSARCPLRPPPPRARAGGAALVAALAALLGAVVAGVVTGVGPLGDAVREITLPLRHEDIIRQQARTRTSTRR